jgi:bacterial/archaeal transporter family protein
MKHLFLTWQFWAVMSAVFAALTAIFAKVGVENVNSDFANSCTPFVSLSSSGAGRAAPHPGQWVI